MAPTPRKSSNPVLVQPAVSTEKTPPRTGGLLGVLREWGDALVIAYLLAMFIRLFVAELYKIPSSSMTPTLLGTEGPRVASVDINGDGQLDMVLRSLGGVYDTYLGDGHHYHYAGQADPGHELERWQGKMRERQDRIIVGKFFYWFTPPERGDIVVFKTPDCIFEREKPIYIKRVVGLPGEKLTFTEAPGVPGHEQNMGYLTINGERVTTPSFFEDQRYEWRNIPFSKREDRPSDYATYRDHGVLTDLLEVNVPEDSLYVFGDNTVSSTDSRYWGKVPFDRLRGRAFFRYNLEYFPYTKEPGFL
jgi:signal peptidase I